MYLLLTIIHVLICIFLVTVILLQSGRGGGLSEMLGGGGGQQAQKMFGTQTNVFLTKLTTYCAIGFVITCISLGFLTSRKSQSLLEGAAIEPFFDATAEQAVTETTNQTTEGVSQEVMEKAQVLADEAKKVAEEKQAQ